MHGVVDGPGVEEHFELNCQTVPGAAGAAAGVAPATALIFAAMHVEAKIVALAAAIAG